MTVETILQHWVLTDFVYPFLLVFFITFAVLEKSKILGGDDKRQLNALVSFVIGLIFVGAIFPKQVVSNMVLFLSVALVIVFVVLILWGFIFSKEGGGMELNPSMKMGLFIVVTFAIIYAILVVLIAIGLGAVIKGSKK